MKKTENSYGAQNNKEGKEYVFKLTINNLVKATTGETAQ